MLLAQGQPWAEIRDFELCHRGVDQSLSQIEHAMGQVLRVGVGKGMGHLDDKEVDHAYELARNRLL